MQTLAWGWHSQMNPTEKQSQWKYFDRDLPRAGRLSVGEVDELHQKGQWRPISWKCHHLVTTLPVLEHLSHKPMSAESQLHTLSDERGDECTYLEGNCRWRALLHMHPEPWCSSAKHLSNLDGENRTQQCPDWVVQTNRCGWYDAKSESRKS